MIVCDICSTKVRSVGRVEIEYWSQDGSSASVGADDITLVLCEAHTLQLRDLIKNFSDTGDARLKGE